MLQEGSSRTAVWLVGIALMGTALTLQWRLNHVSQMFYTREHHDIWQMYKEGRRILEGINPYERALSGDRRENDKYPTYLPGFYCMSALAQIAGLWEYKHWVHFWAWGFQFFHLALAALLFRECLRRANLIYAVFAVILWLFNRWTLYIGLVAHTDGMTLFFVFLSMLLLRERPRTAAPLFGISLAIKQIGIFLLPLYVIWFWQQASDRKLKRTVALTAWTLLIPVAVSLPFFIWNPKGFIWSVGFSVTRSPGGSFATFSLDAMLGQVGLLAKLPLFFMMSCVYLFAAQRHIHRFGAATLIFMLFINFHSIMYQQYVCWVIPFLPMALLEWKENRRDASEEIPTPND